MTNSLLSEAERKTLLFSRNEFNFPDTPEKDLDNRVLRVNEFGNVYFAGHHGWHRNIKAELQFEKDLERRRAYYWKNREKMLKYDERKRRERGIKPRKFRA